MRRRESMRLLTAGLVALSVGLAVAADRSAKWFVGALAGLQSESQVAQSIILGHRNSLSDTISGVYKNNRAPRKWKPGQLKTPAQSGLLKAAPPPSTPISLFPFFAPPKDPDKSDEQEPVGPLVAYRTVCVRLCDGSFVPISASTTRDHFKKDARKCQDQCGAPSRLFVYETESGSPETMVDLKGRRYADLATAFKFRVTYDPDCKCQAHPWEQEAQDRHKLYAEAEAEKSTRALKTAETKKKPRPLRARRSSQPTPRLSEDPSVTKKSIAVTAEVPKSTAELGPKPQNVKLSAALSVDASLKRKKRKRRKLRHRRTAQDVFRSNLMGFTGL